MWRSIHVKEEKTRGRPRMNMLVTSARVFAWARNIKIRIRVLWKYRFNLWGMVLFIYLLIHLFFAVKRKNCGVQSRRNIVHGWVNKRIPWMYANVNYLVNAWVSRNINELFCSRLSSFLFFLILEKKKYLKVREKIQTKL